MQLNSARPELSLRGEKRRGVKVTWDDDVLKCLSEGFKTKSGARSIQNVVQKKVMPVLYRLGKEKETGDIHLSVEGKSIVADI